MKYSELHDYYIIDSVKEHNISLCMQMHRIVIGYINCEFDPSLKLIRREKRIL